METAYKKVIGYKYLIRQNLENPKTDFLRFSQKQNVKSARRHRAGVSNRHLSKDR